MKYADIHNITEKELRTLLAEKRNELRELRFQASERQLKQIHKIRAAKKMIQWILTALNRRMADGQK